MSVRIVDVCEITKPISSPIRNAYIDFTKMTTSLVAVVTDVVRDGRRVVGYGFNSNGRYGQGGLIRERFAPRLKEADPKSLLDASGANLDPDKVWSTLMSNEKPGGHGERSVAVGTIDMAVWDAVAKIAGKPLFRLLAERHGLKANPRVFVYAAGGYYYPGKDLSALRGEMRGYLDRGYKKSETMRIVRALSADRRVHRAASSAFTPSEPFGGAVNDTSCTVRTIGARMRRGAVYPGAKKTSSRCRFAAVARSNCSHQTSPEPGTTTRSLASRRSDRPSGENSTK